MWLAVDPAKRGLQGKKSFNVQYAAGLHPQVETYDFGTLDFSSQSKMFTEQGCFGHLTNAYGRLAHLLLTVDEAIAYHISAGRSNQLTKQNVR